MFHYNFSNRLPPLKPILASSISVQKWTSSELQSFSFVILQTEHTVVGIFYPMNIVNEKCIMGYGLWLVENTD